MLRLLLDKVQVQDVYDEFDSGSETESDNGLESEGAGGGLYEE